MTSAKFLGDLREIHQDCCLTDNCEDQNCSVDLSGIGSDSLAIIHGENYRDRHGDSSSRIADRLVFTNHQIEELSGLMAAVIELKGGMSLHLSDTIEQIRMGMKAVELLLEERSVAAWYPVLMFSGAGKRRPLYVRNIQLQRNRIAFRNDTPKTIFLRDCGTKLTEIMEELGNRYPSNYLSA